MLNKPSSTSTRSLGILFAILQVLSQAVTPSESGQASNFQADLPRIGAYRKNFRSDVTKVISEIQNSEITLPVLRYEDNTWEGHSIELDCNASYPVQWVYTGLGVSLKLKLL